MFCQEGSGACQHPNKCGHCEHFASSSYFLGPSCAEIQNGSEENRFKQISRLVLVSGHIFLHKLYVNAAIGNIFLSCTHMLLRTFTG